MATTPKGAVMPLDVALAVIPSLPRALLARLVERAIEHLDAMAGDCDLEEDDPSGDPLDRGELDEGIMLPKYGPDQSLGPINFGAAYREYQEKLRRRT